MIIYGNNSLYSCNEQIKKQQKINFVPIHLHTTVSHMDECILFFIYL